MGLFSAIAGPILGAVGAGLSAKSARKGAKKAAAAIQGAATTNNALAGVVDERDRAALGAFAPAGNPAGTTINGMLGLGTPEQTATANNAFGAWLDNTDYSFREREGIGGVESAFAAGGVAQSGAALRGIEDYRGDLRDTYRGTYINALDNQQRLAFGATTAQAGLGQNYVNTVSNNNMYAADGQANAALIRAQNNPFAAIAGSLAGSASGGAFSGLKF